MLPARITPLSSASAASPADVGGHVEEVEPVRRTGVLGRPAVTAVAFDRETSAPRPGPPRIQRFRGRPRTAQRPPRACRQTRPGQEEVADFSATSVHPSVEPGPVPAPTASIFGANPGKGRPIEDPSLDQLDVVLGQRPVGRHPRRVSRGAQHVDDARPGRIEGRHQRSHLLLAQLRPARPGPNREDRRSRPRPASATIHHNHSWVRLAYPFSGVEKSRPDTGCRRAVTSWRWRSSAGHKRARCSPTRPAVCPPGCSRTRARRRKPSTAANASSRRRKRLKRDPTKPALISASAGGGCDDFETIRRARGRCARGGATAAPTAAAR